MNKIILIVFSFLFSLFSFLFSAPAGAATPTPASTPVSPSTIRGGQRGEPVKKEVISDLKERIASRVAQLKLVERRGILGTVTKSSDTQITVTDLKENSRFIDVDELTKFSSPSAKGTFGISDIKNGDRIGTLGLYNKQSRRILARFVDVLVQPKIIHGAVVNTDSESFTIKVVSEKGDTTTVDIENITKTLSYTKATGLLRSGFTKIKEGQRIVVVGFPAVKEKNRFIASRIIIFPDTPKNPKIVIPDNSLEEEIVPSTGSGKKLTPITH